MPSKRMGRNAAPALAERLSLAAQPPAPIPLPVTPTPSLSMSRSLGYPTEAEVRAGRGEVEEARLIAAAERHAQASAALDGWAADAGGRFDDALYSPPPAPFYRRVSPQEAQGEPPAWSLPPEVEAELRAPFSASVEPSEEAWAEASLRMMCELLASAGFNALTTRTAHDCRAMAYALLTGRELAS